jgi:hypothetical protein
MLKDLEHNKVLTIAKDPAVNSFALPGDPVSILSFKKWIKDAENTDTVGLSDAKAKWGHKRKRLAKLTK